MAPAVATYAPRDPSSTVLYHVIAEHLETFLASLHDDPEATGLPAYVEREFYDYLRCGILAHGFLRLGCDTCHHELLVPLVCWTTHGADGSAPRRAGQPLGTDTTVGRRGARPLALLDGGLPRAR